MTDEYRAPEQETFEQRRRRIAQQETVWLRARPSQDKRLIESTDEPDPKKTRMDFMDFGFKIHPLTNDKGVFPLEMFPEGWTLVDAKTNSFVLGETKDFWSVEDCFLVRNRAKDFLEANGRIAGLNADEDDQFTTSHKISVREGIQLMLVNSVTAEECQIGYDEAFGKIFFPPKSESSRRSSTCRTATRGRR